MEWKVFAVTFLTVLILGSLIVEIGFYSGLLLATPTRSSVGERQARFALAPTYTSPSKLFTGTLVRLTALPSRPLYHSTVVPTDTPVCARTPHPAAVSTTTIVSTAMAQRESIRSYARKACKEAQRRAGLRKQPPICCFRTPRKFSLKQSGKGYVLFESLPYTAGSKSFTLHGHLGKPPEVIVAGDVWWSYDGACKVWCLAVSDDGEVGYVTTAALRLPGQRDCPPLGQFEELMDGCK